VKDGGELQTFTYTYEYNERGDVIKETTDYSDGTQSVTTYEYTYDEYGGWSYNSVTTSPGFASGGMDHENGDPISLETVYDEDGNLIKETIFYPNILYRSNTVENYHYIYAENLTYGDLDANSELNLTDFVIMNKHLLGNNILIDSSACDLNSDGAVNSADLAIMKYLLLN
jgi:hypothetical protein